MVSLLDSLLVVLLLLNLFALGTSRMRALTQTVALQGVLLGCMPLLVQHEILPHVLLICVATIAVKGVLIPGMLMRALRDLPIRREVEPLIGLTSSMILGAVGTVLALLFSQRLPLAEGHAGGILVPASLATVFTGFLILTSRLKAITQVLGYLILENGIFIFGLLLLEPLPFLVEIGVLLDLFVGIFVMGILIGHINREFSSISTERLSALKE